MGNMCITTGDAVKKTLDPQALQNHAQVEKELKHLKKQLRSEIKILLLGTGECGKTTFMRQMLNMFHQDSTLGDQSYRMLYAEHIRENVLQVLWCITEASNDSRQP
jgi:GTPase SAR1 family protein